ADLVLLAQTQDEAFIAWSLGNGVFTSLQTVPLPTHGAVAAVADVNGDGRPDLLASQYGYARLMVLPGLGAHQFGDEFGTHLASGNFRLAAGDTDADGILDLLSHNAPQVFQVDISVSHGLEGGRFAPPTSLASGSLSSMAVFIDADQDGLDDVARTG